MRLAKYLNESKLKLIRDYYVNNTVADLALYFSAKKYWNKKVNYFHSVNVRAACHTFIVGPIWHAFSEVMRENDILICSFQHGHGREFFQGHELASTFKEETGSDLYFCYSKEAEKFSNNNKYGISEVCPVGLPNAYTRKHKHVVPELCKAEIMYVSTSIHSSHSQSLLTATWSETKKTEHEVNIIEKVLSKAPHSCIYKPYPVSLYPDNYEIKESVNKSNNIIYFEKDFDVSFVKNHAKILITSRATSTLGWCLASSLPVVFINYSSQMPVNDDFKKDIKKSLFYFEGDEEMFFENLRNFLQKPMEDIYRQWGLMSESRNNLWLKYFSLDGIGRKSLAGSRAASIIKSNINKGYS